jgi:hypothetical protein
MSHILMEQNKHNNLCITPLHGPKRISSVQFEKNNLKFTGNIGR